MVGWALGSVLLLAGATPSPADFDSAVRAAYAGAYEVARREFRKLADDGDPRGWNGLGVLYLNGFGVDRDMAGAHAWFRKAAEGGLRAAQTNLGELYENGWGVEQDYPEAANWYRRAAERGDSEAQCALGLLYASGRGVDLSYAEALRWFRAAGEQGHAESQANIGHLYRAGDGVERNYVQAYAWYGIAAAGGYDWAPELRDEVANYLTETELERAQALARAMYRRFVPRDPVLTRQARGGDGQPPASESSEHGSAPAGTRGRYGFSLRPAESPESDDEVQDS